FEQRGMSRYPLVSVPAPIETKRMDFSLREKVRQELGAKEKQRVILHVGRMSPYKGQEVLLQAFLKLRAPDTLLWFVGGAANETGKGFLRHLEIVSRSDPFGENVRFWGNQQSADRYFLASDVYAQPNIKPEPCGIAVVEALSYGLPVVVAAYGGSEDI